MTKYDYKPHLNKEDYKLIILIIIVVLLCIFGRTKTIEDYERGMDSQSTTNKRKNNEKR
tara:strand:- start:303 stop:479 length:177 start_codon:yes stop_codon:yes gene_type:complete